MTTFEDQARAQLDDQRTIRVKHDSIKAYQLMGAVILVVIGIWIGAQVFGNDPGFTVNLYTEALSVLVTVLVIKWFDDRRSRNERKKALMRQLGSQSNEFALEAKRLLEMEDGWLEEALAQKAFVRANWAGIVLPNGADLSEAILWSANLSGADIGEIKLCGASLNGANLSGSRLFRADLLGADLGGANLSKATLWVANLSGSRLFRADLFGVRLDGANLSGASLTYANLSGASLTHANLSGASMDDTNLSAANLLDSTYDADTVLPDGTTWTPDTDMTRFTDPAHPEFWRSNHPMSPAYRGKQDEG